VEEVRRLAPTLPILVLTGRDDEQVALEVLQHGAQDYLHKDFLSPERLAQTLLFAIHRKRVEDSLQDRETALHQHQKLTAIGHLAAGIAHEMNTPLQFVGDNLFFVQESLAKLTKLLTEVQALFADQTVEPAGAVQRLREAARAADVPYLLAELPDAIEQCRGGVHHVARIVHAVKEYCHPGQGQRQRVPFGPLVDRILAVTRHVWRGVRDRRRRYRHRHVRPRSGANLPAILHHQAGRPRNRTGSIHGIQHHRREAPRSDRGRLRGGCRQHVHAAPASRR
jgi:CheY-like chemotaxis protein